MLASMPHVVQYTVNAGLSLVKCDIAGILLVNTRIRLKLMPVLLNSREAAVQFPSCIQVTFDLLFGTSGNSNAKLKMMAVQFVHQIIFHCPEQRLSPIGAVILSALTRSVKITGGQPGSLVTRAVQVKATEHGTINMYVSERLVVRPDVNNSDFKS